MQQSDYKRIYLKNINEGMGHSWYSLTIFLILSPLYMLWLLIVYVSSLPVNFLENRKTKPNKEAQKE